MVPITSGPDVQQWNAVFAVYRKELQGAEPSWFTVSWLFAECFMYRKIADFIKRRYILVLYTLVVGLDHALITFFSSILKSVDPFASKKEDSYRAVLPQVTSLAHFLLELLRKPHKDTRLEFEHLLLVSVPLVPNSCLYSLCISQCLAALPVGEQD